jgi:hypothetical protein
VELVNKDNKIPKTKAVTTTLSMQRLNNPLLFYFVINK